MSASRDRDELGRAQQARPRDRLGRPLPYGSVGVEPVDDRELSPTATLQTAWQLVGEGRAFAAHEVFEAQWKRCPTQERDLWQGLAQLCVALTHAERGNHPGAASLLTRATERLNGYARTGGPTHGVDLEQVVQGVRERISTLAPPT